MEELLDYEKKEINSSKVDCLYTGQTCYKYKDVSKYTREDGMYDILQYNHIQYKYEILDKIGKGQYGSVAKVLDHSTQKERAIKIMRGNNRYKESYNTEVTTLLFLRSKLLDDINKDLLNDLIPDVIDYFKFRRHNMIVYDYYSDNLYDSIIKKKTLIGVDKIRIIMRDLLNTLIYLRKHNIIHGDLKPENILFRNSNGYNIVVIDYGLSIKVNESKNFKIQSMWYRAPEIIFKVPYDFRIDLWSLGCIFYELYFGSAPFRAKTEEDLLKEMYMKLGQPSVEYLHYISYCEDLSNDRLNLYKCYKDLDNKYKIINKSFVTVKNIEEDINVIDIIQRIFEYNPNKRITYEEILNNDLFEIQ